MVSAKLSADDTRTAVDPENVDISVKYNITALEEKYFDLKEMLIPFLQLRMRQIKLPFELKTKFEGIDYKRREEREVELTVEYHEYRKKKFGIEIPKKPGEKKEEKKEEKEEKKEEKKEEEEEVKEKKEKKEDDGKDHYTLPPEYFYVRQVHVMLKRIGDFYRKKKCALLEVQAPVNICGDTHGQFNDLVRIFNACGFPSKTRYLFLGDYVDRGRHSAEVIIFLFCLKLTFSRRIHLLRGNHELKTINKAYGFLAELKVRFRALDMKMIEEMHEHFNEVFSWMPLAACVSTRILCMHGGISPLLNSLDDIRKIPLPLEMAKNSKLACDLLWADPDASVHKFEMNKVRAISYIFGKEQVDELCKKLDIDLIVRAHQVVEFGYAFFADRRLITVFSASRYQEDLANCAGIVNVNKNLEVSFTQLKPEDFEFNNKNDNKEQVTAPEPSAK